MDGVIETKIPHRLDRLPWSRWHHLIVFALGVTWILDGLEVTIVGALGPRLMSAKTLGLSETQVGLSASAYLLGSVFGAIIFSYLIDTQGRKKWFFITLLVYLAATIASAFSWNVESFLFFRFLTGIGIGGEYSAINSAVDELIPARSRGRVDLAINGSWWIGTACGALISVPLLDPSWFPEDTGWRLCFLLGGFIGIAVFLVRRYVPESPRWLVTHGRAEEAEAIVAEIERGILREKKLDVLPPADGVLRLSQGRKITLLEVGQELFSRYPTRSLLGAALMITQSFLYNAVFFSYALVLSKFYHVADDKIGLYIVPIAVSNFLGPLLLGKYFDTIGRRPMIAGTYIISGISLAVSGALFAGEYLTSGTQMLAWSFVFFFASAGASAAYLTVSEIFPLEIRAMSIAFFFVLGQGAGVLAPWIFSMLVQDSAMSVFYGNLAGAACMVAGGIAALRWGVAAEGRPLEEIAPPIFHAERSQKPFRG